MTTRICACCGQPFEPRSQVPKQTYCSSPVCQRARRQRWQRDKMQNDPDYRENQRRSQRAWHDRNPDYWRYYRSTSPEGQDRKTSRKQRANLSSDGSSPTTELRAGLYRIEPARESPGAKMDAWIVQITPVCFDCPCKKDVCKYRT
ncbi:hypothetical protein CJO93_01330 [Ralstonia solanacearum]|nr:hypothetical protein CJO93_01330 [Ralstonia solanacearum]